MFSPDTAAFAFLPQILSALGVTLQVVQAGVWVLNNVPVEQVYAQSQSNLPAALIVSMTVPNLVGATAASPGPNILDSFKVTLRKQNTHALASAAF